MKPVIFIFCFILAAAFIKAQVIRVPADYNTIQEGINAANPGDTVLVADGLYYEQISFLGKKPLMVASHFVIDGDTNHLTNTIIDGSRLTDPDNASVVSFKSGEDTTSILCGFTIRGGKGTWDSVRNNRCGGGIFISGSGAKIVYNKITENTVDDTQPGHGQETYGGGIGTSHEDADFWVVIAHNHIYGNSAVTKYGWAGGGGIYDSYNTRITENLIAGNHSLATTDGWGSGGGFSHADLNGGASNTLIILNNRFQQNSAKSIDYLGVDGAATTVNAHLTFAGNEVIDNTGITGVDWGGGLGGLSIINPASGCKVTGNIFRENHGTLDGGAIILENEEETFEPELVEISENYFLFNEGTYGGAVRSNDIPVIFRNNVFHGNQASITGGALYFQLWYDHPFDHFVTLINNTFSENSAGLYGGALFSNKAMPLLVNSVFFTNSALSGGSEVYLGTNMDTIDMAFCNIDQALIHGNIFNGGGNINAAPIFDDPELLTPGNGTPCMDAGATSYICRHGDVNLCPDHDILGAIRPQGSGVDIGAYEMMPGGVGDPFSKIPPDWMQIRPNPVYDLTVLRYELDYEGPVEINLYNNFGSLIKQLLKDTQLQGSHTLVFETGDLSAGIYFCQIRTGNQSFTGKVVVVR